MTDCPRQMDYGCGGTLRWDKDEQVYICPECAHRFEGEADYDDGWKPYYCDVTVVAND